MDSPIENALHVVERADPLARLKPLVEAARDYAAASLAKNTRAAYDADWRTFTAWCEMKGLPSRPAPSAVIATYLAHLADERRRVSTIERALAGIVHAHRAAGYEFARSKAPIPAVLAGIRRKLGIASRKKAPVCDDELRALVGTLGVDLIGLRDRALLTLGWFTASRRSEIVGIHVEDVAFVREGVRLTIRRSKTDQEARGTVKGVPYAGDPAVCPVRALRGWLDASRLENGPIFRAVLGKGEIAQRGLHAKRWRASSSAALLGSGSRRQTSGDTPSARGLSRRRRGRARASTRSCARAITVASGPSAATSGTLPSSTTTRRRGCSERAPLRLRARPCARIGSPMRKGPQIFAVIESPTDVPSFVGALSAKAWPPFVRLGPNVTDLEVALVVAQLSLYGGAQAASLRQLAENFPHIAPGGLAAEDGEDVVFPSCCCGLEAWREWHLLLSKGTSPWLGHDPSPWVEARGEDFLIWPDGGLSGGNSESLTAIHLSRAELATLLENVERDLRGFVDRLRDWTSALDPEVADPIAAGFRALAKLNDAEPPPGEQEDRDSRPSL
jgi:integrase